RNMEENNVPGAVVGVLHEGHVGIAAGGVTSVENPLPVEDSTLFQIGSITKTFTAAALMRLVERGLVDLDRPVRDYLPEFRVADEKASSGVTPRHLLTHHCGWEGDLFIDTGFGDDALARYVAAMGGQPQIVPLGSYFSYNNSGFTALGRMIETITGQTFERAVTALVLGPLGLDRVYLSPLDVLTRRFAAGHLVVDGEPAVARPWALPRASGPVGGIATDMPALLEYARFNLGLTAGRDQVLAPETVAQMHSPQREIWEGKEAVGLSWFIDRFGGEVVVNHQGSTSSQVSGLFLVPGRDFAVGILTNADQGGKVVRKMKAWAFERYLGLTAETPTQMQLEPEALQEYAGRYDRAFAAVNLAVEEGKMAATFRFKQGFPTADDPPPPNPPPMGLAMIEKDRFLILDGAWKDGTMDVIRNADGEVAWLRAYRRIHAKI
ncbi:MAG: serine hydrolase domain-containing protein, partial [Anaerolineales bacterium]|nr:serine hydrolase domain-containing protein [Anaerolineales bacterium]